MGYLTGGADGFGTDASIGPQLALQNAVEYSEVGSGHMHVDLW